MSVTVVPPRRNSGVPMIRPYRRDDREAARVRPHVIIHSLFDVVRFTPCCSLPTNDVRRLFPVSLYIKYWPQFHIFPALQMATFGAHIINDPYISWVQ